MRIPEQDFEKDSMSKRKATMKVEVNEATQEGVTQESVVPVTKDNQDAVLTFLRLGRDYFKRIPGERRKKFVQSILARQGEPDRWLVLLRYRNEYVGFAHFKIDEDELIGWGFILEFYIVPSKRMMGLGRAFFNRIAEMLQARDVRDVWLLSGSASRLFWRAIGFKSDGRVEEETGQDVMIKSLGRRADCRVA